MPRAKIVIYNHENIQYEPITPEFAIQIQAVWRIMLGGNAKFNKYFSESGIKYDGINDTNFTTGGVAKSTGKDYSYDAYKAYGYDYDTVTLRRMAFAFWSLSPEGLYCFAAFDVEPLIAASRKAHPTPNANNPKKEADPTRTHREQVYMEAYIIYDRWINLSAFDDRILAVILEESSPNHYHVWTLFTCHLTEAEHDNLVTLTRGTPRNLDKDTTSKRHGLGDMYRAPCTWKDGRQSRVVRFWYRSHEALLARAAELAPPPKTKKCDYIPTNDPTDPATLLQFAITNYPIRPQTRDKVQGALILALLNRGVDPNIIRSIGPDWLNHFNNQDTEPDKKKQNFKTKPTQAAILFNKCVDITLKHSTRLNVGGKSTLNYLEFATNYVLSGRQLDFIGRTVGVEDLNLFITSITVMKKLDSTHPPADNKSTKEVTKQQNCLVVEALLILIEINKSQGLTVVRFTHNQIIEIIKVRRGVEIVARQFQNIKGRFCSYKLSDGSWHTATMCELLRETLKGTTGLASEYEIADVVRELVGVGGGGVINGGVQN